MPTHKKPDDSVKYYRPTEDLVNYLKEELQTNRLKRDKVLAGKELSEAEQKLDKNLNKRKSTWMDRIFQDWADMLFFLDFITNFPELKEEFEDELDDLFGLSYPISGRLQTLDYEVADGLPWYRFLAAALGESDTDNTSPKMILAGVCQEIIKNKIHSILEDNEYIQYASPQVIRRIDEDFGLALSWINYIEKVKPDDRHASRMIEDPNTFIFKKLKADKTLERAF